MTLQQSLDEIEKREFKNLSSIVEERAKLIYAVRVLSEALREVGNFKLGDDLKIKEAIQKCEEILK